MDLEPQPESPELLKKIYLLFRDYFDRAEKKRRWNIRQDIPWDQCNRALSPAIADVVETFCAVELYLPDYLSKTLPQVRTNRGRAWMMANWGYEESKHSLALGDWLLRAHMRSDEHMADMEGKVFSHEYHLPYDNARGMVCYTMFQELATWLHYHNLRKIVDEQCPALDRVLQLISIDEKAHYNFFMKLVKLYLEEDREATLEQIRRVANTFAMPAVNLLADSRRRTQEVRSLRIFDEDIFIYEVYEPVVRDLGITKADLRRRHKRELLQAGAGSP